MLEALSSCAAIDIHVMTIHIHAHMQIVLLTFLYFLLWLSLSIVLSLLVTIYIELAWACPQLGVNDSQPNQVGIMDKCFEFGGNPSETMIIAFLW